MQNRHVVWSGRPSSIHEANKASLCYTYVIYLTGHAVTAKACHLSMQDTVQIFFRKKTLFRCSGLRGVLMNARHGPFNWLMGSDDIAAHVSSIQELHNWLVQNN
jgi:hypothetical protein